MKTCRKCGQILDITEFALSKVHADGHEWRCKGCRRAANREFMRRKRNKNPHKQSMTRNMKWLIDYKSTLSCVRCGENHPACIQFHHVDPSTKVEEIPKMVRKPKTYSLDDVKTEIRKCVVLCSNCHRKEHYEQHQNKMNALLLDSDA